MEYYKRMIYQMYAADDISYTQAKVAPAPERTFEEALRVLLADATFLPAGGLLAFGLAHQYPMPTQPETVWDEKTGGYKHDTEKGAVGPVLQMLKGSDARIRTVAEHVGLATHVKMLYDSGESVGEGGRDVLQDYVLRADQFYVDDDTEEFIAEVEKGGIILERGEERVAYLKAKRGRYYSEDGDEENDQEVSSKAVAVHWVTQITELNRVGSPYMAYGNEASLEHIYGNAALFVNVPPMGEGIRAA
ncbi:hypothetical protein B0H15DRAFT_971757 [Mycena belliarum]|uniref:Uncharacterized protein n=1 Tax=Mycena belliarum TaxID=1033014 RepID=A0AAD6U9Y4_9AGAR|nr:hypothetical protein B0H15DRAFT_971757 [Mycena belliae]